MATSGASSSAPRVFGVLGTLEIPLALGLLRLTVAGRPSEEQAIELIHAALDRGVRVVDTADVYCLDNEDVHYGERLVRNSLGSWRGPRDEVKILTKAGLTRPKGRWLPNGRPEHLRRAVEGSLEALGVDRLFLLQLHARDPKVPFEETLCGLAELRRAGKVEHLGLCNVTPGELWQAQRHFPVALVQNELSILTRKSAADGLLTLTAEQNIPFLAYRPLGGEAKVEKLAKSNILGPLAQRHGATPAEMALAALLDAGPHVVPLFGATRMESIQSSVKATRITLDISDRTALSIKYSFAADPETLAGQRRLYAVARQAAATTEAAAAPVSPVEPGERRIRPRATGVDVVVIMGIQGAGKSQLVAEFVDRGYARLNRDILGGKLDDLVPRMLGLFAAGQRRVVLDNTYPTRLSRAAVVAAAHAQGVSARCIFLQTPLAEAHVNIVLRCLERYGRLLGPEDMKQLAKTDPNLPPPAALARWVNTLEKPSLDEGFAELDVITFKRHAEPNFTAKGLLLDVDGTLRKTKSGEIYPRHPDDLVVQPGRREVLLSWIERGYQIFFVSNQSGIASGKLGREAAEACFRRTIELLGLPVAEVAYCPHPAFPVGCYCRKPMPGLGVYLMQRHRLAGAHLVMVGDMASDAEFARNLGARYVDAARFFDSSAG